MAKKSDAKSFALKRRKRRQWITFVRMIRYGINNFSRNTWLTIAATAVMTITLLIVFLTLAARETLSTTVDEIRSKVDISIYIKNGTTKEQIKPVRDELERLKTVRATSFTSSDEARKDFAKTNSSDASILNALNEATNKLPATIHINLVDINNTSELENFVKTNQTLKPFIDSNRPPSYAGERRDAIKNLGSAITFADRAGMAASVVFIVISALIVFNTIRMAIFNRKEEIQMMKLIGADKSFIRGPFIVEAIVYGFVAAIIATGLGMMALFAAEGPLSSYKVAIQPTIHYFTTYVGFILLGMIVVGAVIGVVSSLLATRRYLKL